MSAEGCISATWEGPSDPSRSAPQPTIVIGWVTKALFGLVMLVLLVLTVGPKLYPFQTFYVRTGSMVPTVPVGALVVATRAPASALGTGDIVVFERPDRPGVMVVHRISAVEVDQAGRVFVTKGDANSAPDAWRIPATGTGWRYAYSIPRAGFVVGWLHIALSQRGWLGAVAIAAAVYALMAIWKSENP